MIGLLVGAVIGGSMHGFYGAMWGATIGFLGALLLARKNNPAEKSAKDDRLERLEKLIAQRKRRLRIFIGGSTSSKTRLESLPSPWSVRRRRR